MVSAISRSVQEAVGDEVALAGPSALRRCQVRVDDAVDEDERDASGGQERDAAVHEVRDRRVQGDARRAGTVHGGQVRTDTASNPAAVARAKTRSAATFERS